MVYVWFVFSRYSSQCLYLIYRHFFFPKLFITSVARFGRFRMWAFVRLSMSCSSLSIWRLDFLRAGILANDDLKYLHISNCLLWSAAASIRSSDCRPTAMRTHASQNLPTLPRPYYKAIEELNFFWTTKVIGTPLARKSLPRIVAGLLQTSNL